MLNENASLKELIDTYAQIDSRLVDRGGARTINPSTTNQTLLKGNYKGDITINGDVNLIPENIKRGMNIFGVVGTHEDGKKYASGMSYMTNQPHLFEYESETKYMSFYYITIEGLGFKPSYMVCYCDFNASYNVYNIVTLQGVRNGNKPVVNIGRFDNDRLDTSNYTLKVDGSVFPSSNIVKVPIRTEPPSDLTSPVYWVAFE